MDTADRDTWANGLNTCMMRAALPRRPPLGWVARRWPPIGPAPNSAMGDGRGSSGRKWRREAPAP